jgi:cyclohexanone monooxygenase
VVCSVGVGPARGGRTRNEDNYLVCRDGRIGWRDGDAEQAIHVAHIVKHCTTNQVRVIEATPEAEEEWVETIKKLAVQRRKFLEECTPGYYNNEGQIAKRAEQDGFYGAGPVAFVKVLEDWRAEGAFKGLEQRKA